MHYFSWQLDFGGEDCHMVWFPEHKALLQNLHDAKNAANKTGARAYFTWRGHRDFVNPGRKKITKLDFHNHLIAALKVIKELSPEEEKVGFYKHYYH